MADSTETIRGFANHLQSHGKQPATIESYCRDASRFLDYLSGVRLQPKDVDPDTLVHYQDHMRHACRESDNTIRRSVIGVRQFYRYLTNEQLLAKSGGTSPFDYVAIPTRDDSLPDPLTEADVDELLLIVDASRPPIKKFRDGAIVSLLAFEGLKANEMIHLKWRDLLLAGDHASLQISGTRARAITLCPTSRQRLTQYRDVYAEFVGGESALKERNMFLAFKGREAARSLPAMTRHGLKFMLYELGDKAGIHKLNTEALRHFAITYLIEAGHSPEEIMQKLGLRRLGVIAKHFRRAAPSEKH